MAHPPASPARTGRLVAVSNRLPHLIESGPSEEARGLPVGGLVSALWPALEERNGLWIGWSGRPAGGRRALRSPRPRRLGGLDLLEVDLTDAEVEAYYNGFSNRALWPLLHGFVGRVSIRSDEWAAYREVNRRFAEAVHGALEPGDQVWVHDYHLFPLAAELRELGWTGPIGFFLHTPFPPHDTFSILPWAKDVLTGMGACSLVGFHTERYAHNYVDTATREAGAGASGRVVQLGAHRQVVGAYPIGSDPDRFAGYATSAKAEKMTRSLRKVDRGLRLVLAVDRLDYTKGVPNRLRAFAHMLSRYPSWRKRVRFLQVSAPSRTRVPEYLRLKTETEQLVGEINGRYGEADWSPVRYLYRSFDHQELAALYREADVCMVTPLQDGMNLVSKEFVSCQREEDPGVLMLSRFCGAAAELTDAVLVNPYDVEAMGRALADSLDMPLAERQRRHKALMARCTANTAKTWRDAFLADLGTS